MNRIAATRMNLLKARRRLGQVGKGTALLRRKREALVTELFRVARGAVDAREQIGARAADAYPTLLRALGTRGALQLAVAGWPTRSLEVDVRGDQVWGIAVADIVAPPTVRRSMAARGTVPGSTGPAVVETARRFEALAELLLEAAAPEVLLRRLGGALAHTSRQVRTLEQRVAPRLQARIRAVRQTLDEREGEDHLRLKFLVASRRAARGR